jgi:hypothetical protein
LFRAGRGGRAVSDVVEGEHVGFAAVVARGHRCCGLAGPTRQVQGLSRLAVARCAGTAPQPSN